MKHTNMYSFVCPSRISPLPIMIMMDQWNASQY